MAKEHLPLAKDQLPPLHDDEKAFFAGEHNSDKYGFDYDKDVIPNTTKLSSSQLSRPEAAARLSAKLALLREVSIDLPDYEPEKPETD